MKSYATIDRIEGKFAVCEVELFSVEESNTDDFVDYETVWIDIPLQDIPASIGEVNEKEILVVEHDGQNVTEVYYKDEQERAKRLALLRDIMGW